MVKLKSSNNYKAGEDILDHLNMALNRGSTT